ncbi:MAG: GNAT family N-acetyltransferase [Thermoanaerobaculia bacterium]|nr:GNAT family N-acetyltransferase [Thermoanaerobaculia bacterium]
MTDAPQPSPVRPQPPIRLRPVATEDAPLLQRWRSEPSVRRYQPLSQLSIAQLVTEIRNRRPSDLYRGQGHRFDWIVELGGNPVGWITLSVPSWEQGLGECGYSLTTAYQGGGIMRRALGLLLREIFSRTTLFRLEARCAEDNEASRHLLEGLGFRREGTLRGYLQIEGRRIDSLLYARLRDDEFPESTEHPTRDDEV